MNLDPKVLYWTWAWANMALVVAYKLRLANDDGSASDDPRRRRSHRRAGWTALIAGALGLLTSAYVLLGMYQRL